MNPQVWTDRHDQAIQRTHASLLADLQACDSRDACKAHLEAAGWPCGFSAAGEVSEAVKATIAFYAVQSRCEQIMADLKAKHDAACTTPQQQTQGLAVELPK